MAYGSLIDDPGEEISEFEIDRIECKTPFNVEFARISSTRSNAPTLIPFKEGLKVRAVIIVLSEKIDISEAKTILWRREIHNVDGKDKYVHTETYNANKVVVETLNNFMAVETVLYTSIGNNINQLITGDLLADYAINSILQRAGQEEKDGIRYLLRAKENGIVTKLSDEYEKKILSKTDSKSLDQVIRKLDRKRIS